MVDSQSYVTQDGEYTTVQTGQLKSVFCGMESATEQIAILHSIIERMKEANNHEMSEAEIFSAGWHNGYHCGSNGLGGQLASDLMIFMAAKQR